MARTEMTRLRVNPTPLTTCYFKTYKIYVKRKKKQLATNITKTNIKML